MKIDQFFDYPLDRLEEIHYTIGLQIQLRRLQMKASKAAEAETESLHQEIVSQVGCDPFLPKKPGRKPMTASPNLAHTAPNLSKTLHRKNTESIHSLHRKFIEKGLSRDQSIAKVMQINPEAKKISVYNIWYAELRKIKNK